MKACVFKAGSKVENLSIHSQKMRTFSMTSLTFFCALKHCSELSKSCSRLLLLKIRTGLNPGNEARPINPFPSSGAYALFHFLALVSFLALPKPVFLCSESKRKRFLRRLFQMFRCSRKFSAGTTRPKKPCFILIYFPTGLSGTFL